MVDSSYNYILSQIFSPSLVKNLNDSNYEKIIQNILVSSGLYSTLEDWNLSHALSVAYNYLKANYRCEYVYKNEIANQLHLTYHDCSSSALLKEVSSHHSIADIVIVNGRSVAYEIKTELDNLDRLSSQLSSYIMLYDEVNIVTHRTAIDIIRRKVDKRIGIIILNNDGILEKVRNAKNNLQYFDPEKAIFTLRQSELVLGYEKLKGKFPNMGSGLVFQFCWDWYLSLSKKQAHKLFADALRSRKLLDYQMDLVNSCDVPLKMLFLGKQLSKKQCTYVKEKLGIFTA